mmetsp:Transcript_6100/g.14045  ORF Transcript_6100/g.14045 Transcript_6100/m.14045 type:complete len:228 (+) Transcript_6100:1173-1856(+)
MLVLQHEREQCLRIHKSLFGRRGARILAVIRELAPHAIVRDSVGVHHGRTATRHHGPDAALLVQDGQLQRSTRLAVHVTDERLLGVGGAAERRGPVNLPPLLRNQEVGGLVNLRGHVQRHHCVVFQHHQGVDFQICEVQILVEFVEALNERRQTGLFRSWHLRQQTSDDLLLVGALPDRYLETLSLRVYVPDVNTTLMVEQDLVVVAHSVDTDVELLILFMGHHWLD